MQLQRKLTLNCAQAESNPKCFSRQQKRGLIRLSVGVGGPVRVGTGYSIQTNGFSLYIRGHTLNMQIAKCSPDGLYERVAYCRVK